MADEDAHTDDTPVTTEPQEIVELTTNPATETMVPEPLPEPIPAPVSEPVPDEPTAPIVAEPPAEIAPVPAPLPEPTVEPPVEPTIIAPAIPEIPPTPESEPTDEVPVSQPKPAPQVEVVKTPPMTPPVVDTLPVAPTPAVAQPVVSGWHDPKHTKGIPQKILDLSPEELDAARLLWARENIERAREQSYVNRREHMQKMNAEIETLVRASTETTTREIAQEMHISEKSASGYLYRLVKAGRIKESGNSHNKKYFD